MGKTRGFAAIRLLLSLIVVVGLIAGAVFILSYAKIIPNPLEELQYLILRKAPGTSKMFYQNPFARRVEEKKPDIVNPFVETSQSYQNPFATFE